MRLRLLRPKSFLLAVGFLASCSLPTVVRQPSNLAVSGPKLDKSGYVYDPADRSCDGFPRLKVETLPGTCLGLVLAKDNAIDPLAKRGFSMPRTVAQIPGTKDFLVADMGSWHPTRGALFRLSLQSDGTYALKLLKENLDFPHAVKVGPDGKFWIGELKQISRFTLAGDMIANWEPMVTGLPSYADASHPLSQFTFDPRNNDLYINSGSPSDHCFVKQDGVKECPEVKGNDLAGILKVTWADLNLPAVGGARKWVSVARGLRNSMAIAISPAGYLVQGENSRDFSSFDEPYEELNVVKLNGPNGFHYGWPYCYDFRATSPDWKTNDVVDCASGVVPAKAGQYQEPYVLIPPHAAPLGATYYHGAAFPQLEGKLLMAWHGYRPTGHRLVAYNVDQNGLPKLSVASNARNAYAKGKATFKFDRRGNGCPMIKPMNPRDGLTRYSPYTELISRWNEREGIRPIGAPASVTVADDGTIWMAEDKNQTIVRLAPDSQASVQEACDPDVDDRVELLAWRRAISENPTLMSDFSDLQSKMIVKYCATCHDGGRDTSVADDRLSGLDFIVNNRWFVPGKLEKSKAYLSIIHEGSTPPMPLPGSPQFFGTAEGAEIQKLVERWVGEIPSDISSRYTKSRLPTSRKVRASPSGKVCGALAAGTTVYTDRRLPSFTTAGGWKWAKVYLTPDHKALSSKACSWPMDGVFYIATEAVK